MNSLLQGPSSVRLDSSFLRLCRRARRTSARQYSTPSASRAQALAQAVHASPESNLPSPPEGAEMLSENIRGFFRRSHPYVVIPTPLPLGEETTPEHDYYFPDSPTQDMLAILDTCLHEAYDIPRAKYVFEMIRHNKKGDSVINTHLLNSMLEAYLLMATERDVAQRTMWVTDLWELYESMEVGKERQAPNAATYAIILVTWLRFNIDSMNPVLNVSERNPTSLLRSILDRQVSIESVVSSYTIASSEEAAQIIQHLSRAAVETSNANILATLGRMELLGADPMEGIPDVRPVIRETKATTSNEEAAENQTVNSAYEVPFNLDTLRKHLADIAFARRVLPDDVSSRQKLLESSVYDVAQERLRYESEKLDELGLGDKGLKDRRLQAWMYDWHQKLEPRLRAEIKTTIDQERKLSPENWEKTLKFSPKSTSRLGSFLSLLSPAKLSLITILELMQLQGTGGVSEGMKTARALLTVGRAVELEHKAEVLKKYNIQVPAVATRTGDSSYFTKMAYENLQQKRLAAQSHMESATEWTAEWTANLRVRVGSFLVDCLMDVATVKRSAINKRTGEVVEEDQPAFFHSYEYVFGRKLGVIRLNPVVAERLAKDEVSETVHPRHLPMLVPPKPWLSYNDGGYIYNKNIVMRFKDAQEQLAYVREASEKGNLELVYAALDVLGSTAWKINKPVFDVVLKVWNTGERILKIPPAVFDQPEPVKPLNYDTDPQARAAYLPNLKKWTRQKADAHSDRCSVNYKMEIARAFIGDTLYFPHNVDFRGRAYPIPPHLNHLGDDLSRGLMTFADAKPLGESGFRWLKIHLANLYGFDKGNFEERMTFADEHMDDIIDSANDPLGGRRWWMKADDPWQCLATCFDLRNAVESGNPLEYHSSQPVHQDGTCNGLQHYAALGGDAKGAQQVNLDVTDRPSDVYTFVANMVEVKVAEDCEKGHEYALMLKGKIARKVVKQTVMTTVYGVTFVGAREQLEKQLIDRGDVPAEHCWNAASYLAKEVLSAIGDLFTGAKDIQNWFTTCARLISKAIPPERIEEAMKPKSKAKAKANDNDTPAKLMKRLVKEQMTSVVWTTPLGLPIVQPYRKTDKKQIMTALQSVYISDPNAPAQVNAVKQASAFPPNFIHSLDATHMMLTALECRSSGLTYASVHDSYWTHACTIDKMSEIIRDTFIILHQADTMQRLETEFRERYAEYKIPIALLTRSKSLLAAVVGKKQPSVKKRGAKAKAKKAKPKAPASESEEVEAEEVSDEADSVSPLDLGSDEFTTSFDLDLEELEARSIPGFLNVVDLLPPVPKKGDFDVNKIKQSKYFFS